VHSKAKPGTPALTSPWASRPDPPGDAGTPPLYINQYSTVQYSTGAMQCSICKGRGSNGQDRLAKCTMIQGRTVQC